jgi:mannose-6-phosphate isomerase
MPARLARRPLEKVWGSPLTEPWYRNPEGKGIGEIWFEASDSVPLLVKFLFTSANLSVQVHPGDEYARVHENGSPGKTEMWHVLRAEAGAKVAIGLKERATRERVLAAALSGEIVEMLRWIEVAPGDSFFIPAGTIHAIGGGLALCEVQQLSDVTYRLFDYGRKGRELHLEKGLDVADPGPREAYVPRTDRGGGRSLLAECRYFRTERMAVRGSATLEARARNYLCIALAGEGTVAGVPFGAGEGWEVAAGSGPFLVESPDAVMLITQVP